MICPYCGETRYTPSHLPSTKFNGKIFDYRACQSCQVLYIAPLPDDNDYAKMYPPGYQSGVNKFILPDKYKKLPGLRFSYGLQFDLIKKNTVNRPTILDYGCGNANFLLNARAEGFLCDGAEFNEEHVSILRNEVSESNFHLISEFLKNESISYDVIRLSNVLEHLDNPNEIIRFLTKKLNKNGLLLVEGPIECNFNLAYLSRKIYFLLMKKIKNGYVSKHTPTHITFTNAQNQLAFLNKFGLQLVEYTITESPWPYPESMSEAKGIRGKIQYIIAKVSIWVSSCFKGWGNTFLYIGKKGT